jgi:tRNA dimethylallyltransferase
VYTLKRDTRHFAKRQLTWFKRERDVIWLDKRDYGRQEEKILGAMLEILEQRGICQKIQKDKKLARKLEKYGSKE